MIELVTAMIAATVLLLSLASTVVLSTRLMNSPLEDRQQWHDREIADRLAADLRYATDIDDTLSYGFSISKPNAVTGVSEQAVYETYLDELTRQIDNGPVISLDAQAPSEQFAVDGYTGPTYIAPSNVVRVRASSSAVTSGVSSSLQVDLPPGCINGDLLVLVVAARTPSVQTLPSEWNQVAMLVVGTLRMWVSYKTYDDASTGPITLQSIPSAGMSAAITAIENVDVSDPIRWFGSMVGTASNLDANTHPTPLEPANFEPNQLNVQLFAAVGQPWYDGSLGLASFTDVVQDTGAASSAAYANSVAVAVRTGSTPNLATTARVLHRTAGDWAQVGLQLGVAP